MSGLVVLQADELRALLREAVRAELDARAPANDGPRPEDQPEKMLGVRPAAERVGRCVETIRRAIGRKDLKAAKPPGSREWLIAESDLLAWASSKPARPAVDFGAAVDKAVARARAGRG